MDKKFVKRPIANINPGDYAYGIQPVLEALTAEKDIERILIQRDSPNEQYKTIVALAETRNVPVAKVPLNKLNSITRKNHQGVVAYVSAVSFSSLDNIISEAFAQGRNPLVLLLDRITDVRNFGAITRTAECLGVDAVVIPARGGAQVGSDAMRTSAGALNYLSLCRYPTLKQAVDFLKQSGLQVFACTEKASEHIYQQDFSGPTAIVLGSEEDGISDDIIRQADGLAKIPMQGKIGSLNVSVSAGVVLAEAIRQRL